MGKTLNSVYKDEVAAAQTAIAGVETAGTATYKGATVGKTELPRLYVVARLFQYRLAEQVITEGGQSYQVDGRRVTRADLPYIADKITVLEAELRTIDQGGIALKRVVPL